MTISTVTTDTQAADTCDVTGEIKTFYAVGLYWVFWMDAENYIAFATAPDAVTWSAKTEVTNTCTDGDEFSTWVSGTTLYYSCSNGSAGSPNNFAWRYGTLNPNGTISWSIAETLVTVANTSAYFPFISVDLSENVWVTLETIDSPGNMYVDVYEYSGGTWTNKLNLSYGSGDFSNFHGRVLPMPSGDIALLYITNTSTPKLQSYNGSTWTSAVSPASSYQFDQDSAVIVGSSIHYVGVASDGTVRYWRSTYPFSAISAETILDSGTTGAWACIQTDLASTLVAIFAVSASTIKYTTSANSGTTWGTETILTSAETQLEAPSGNSPYALNGSVATVLYSVGDIVNPPWTVKFGSFTIPSSYYLPIRVSRPYRHHK